MSRELQIRIRELEENLSQIYDELELKNQEIDKWQSSVERALHLDYHSSHTPQWAFDKIRKNLEESQPGHFDNCLDHLPEKIKKIIFPLWKKPSKSLFSFLAENYPISLVILIESGYLDAHCLEIALRTMGEQSGQRGEWRDILDNLSKRGNEESKRVAEKILKGKT